MKLVITRLYLEFLFLLITFIPPKILSSVRVINAEPVVSTNILYLPPEKLR